MSKRIPIIDLFAGPGGLGEGFSALRHGSRPVFRIALSIEKDAVAHRTLELRAFFRQFAGRTVPDEYYSYVSGAISREELFAKYPLEAGHAKQEAWHAELGAPSFSSAVVSDRIQTALNGERKWLLIGGPPCQAYSLVGRSKIIGEKGIKEYESDHRHFLYREYLRIIAEHRPPVFVMENVKGLLSARIGGEGTITRILSDLRRPIEAHFGPNPGRRYEQLTYRLVPIAVPAGDLIGDPAPSDFLVRAEEYGVPQARHRVILVGIADSAVSPRLLERRRRVPIEDAIGDLPKLRSGLSKEIDSGKAWRDALLEIQKSSWIQDSKISEPLRREIYSLLRGIDPALGRGGEWSLRGRRTLRVHREWYLDERLLGVCNHSTRSHIREDIHRYFFVSAFAKVYGRSPLLNDFPRALLPKHENVSEALKTAKFNDRFRVQTAGRPGTTITSHISKDGHYFIHYDPSQCRSLTVREAARLQTFPDNYFFEGPRTQQYHQVGNAVPPFLAYQIADIVSELFDK